MWWMVDVCFSHVLNEENLTHAQEKCLDLDLQATNIMFRSLHDCIFREIMDIKTAHKIWSYLNEKNGAASDDDNELKEEVHEDVEHIHNMVVVEDCSTSWSSDQQAHLTRLMMLIQVLQVTILLQAHLMIKLVHAWMTLLLQAHLYHNISSCHKVTQRY